MLSRLEDQGVFCALRKNGQSYRLVHLRLKQSDQERGGFRPEARTGQFRPELSGKSKRKTLTTKKSAE
ncbi:hypothetical protein FBY58_1826 [Zymomonas mobilis]|uniref:Uncharacterized protein n=1 Tax=Zymomonas mobilis TaxID=542 RepID=A0A542VUG8_ZYMMB|nr:hypothetical protein FBY58_1826 [Zymomonas mobilis]